jgi:hypothetical protein
VFIEKLEAFDTSENLMFRKKIFRGAGARQSAWRRGPGPLKDRFVVDWTRVEIDRLVVGSDQIELATDERIKARRGTAALKARSNRVYDRDKKLLYRFCPILGQIWMKNLDLVSVTPQVGGLVRDEEDGAL